MTSLLVWSWNRHNDTEAPAIIPGKSRKMCLSHVGHCLEDVPPYAHFQLTWHRLLCGIHVNHNHVISTWSALQNINIVILDNPWLMASKLQFANTDEYLTLLVDVLSRLGLWNRSKIKSFNPKRICPQYLVLFILSLTYPKRCLKLSQRQDYDYTY